jgi:acyl-CoA thioesterase FadM
MSNHGIGDDLYDVFENRVRFAETDAQGIVFYGDSE